MANNAVHNGKYFDFRLSGETTTAAHAAFIDNIAEAKQKPNNFWITSIYRVRKYCSCIHFHFLVDFLFSSICYYCCELLLFFLLLVSIWNKFSWKIDCLAVIYKMLRRILWTLFHQFSKSFAIFLYIKLLNVKMIHFSTKWKFINFTWKQFSVLFLKKIFLCCNNSAYFGIQLLEPMEIWIKFPAAGNETNVMKTEIWRLLKLRIQNSWPKIDAYKFNMNKIKAQYSGFISPFKICLGVFVNIKKFIAVNCVHFLPWENGEETWMAKTLKKIT